MKLSALLLCVSVPCVLGRLGHLSSTENETFFAKNEVSFIRVCSMSAMITVLRFSKLVMDGGQMPHINGFIMERVLSTVKFGASVSRFTLRYQDIGIRRHFIFQGTNHLPFPLSQVPLFHSSEQDLVFDINDLDLLTASHLEDDSFDQDVPPFDLAEFEHKALPFDLMSPDEVVVFDEDNAFNDSNIAMTARHGRRKLQSSAMQVTIRNDCSLQPFLLAIIYYSTSEGRVVHKGWCK